MKRILYMVFTLVLLGTMAACGGKAPNTLSDHVGQGAGQYAGPAGENTEAAIPESIGGPSEEPAENAMEAKEAVEADGGVQYDQAYGYKAEGGPGAAAEGSGGYAAAPDGYSEAPYWEQYSYDGYNSNESYSSIIEQDFVSPLRQPLSTFSADVDTAAYSNVRRMIYKEGYVQPDAVRIEEMINYFTYDYPAPTGNSPVSVTTELVQCPWNNQNLLMSIGLRAKDLERSDSKPSNLVFLIDVSGSMNDANKLPLVQRSFGLLVSQLGAGDRVSIVTYADAEQIVLQGESGGNKAKIMNAINELQSGGSTNGSQGILAAYDLAQRFFIRNGNNRVILATDGDFNVGVTNDYELTRLIESERDKGVFLSVMGYGMGNYKDSKMEMLAQNGNGNYAYIDSLYEARKVLVQEMGANMFTVAKDVKLQVEFNPGMVAQYRLIGYEHRLLEAQDFLDDQKDAGEMGAGHTVTALYEIVPAASGAVPALKYQSGGNSEKVSGEYATVKVRYKQPQAGESQEISRVVKETTGMGKNTALASSVAEFGLILRNSPYANNTSTTALLQRVQGYVRSDDSGYIKEFCDMVQYYQQNFGVY